MRWTLAAHLLTDDVLGDLQYHQFVRELAIAIVVAWLHEARVTFESDEERDHCISMWLHTPYDTLCLWLDSDWVDGPEPEDGRPTYMRNN